MVIVIGDNQWLCSLASTYTEIKTGLSGVESLPAGQGMLFDVGYDRSRIDINMSEMLFPLDIVFANSNLTVVGVLHDVQPGDEAYFLASNSLGARYFMEVNAGEAASINVGDVVTVTNGTNGLVSFDMNTMLQYMVFAVVLMMITRMTVKALKPAEKKPLLLAEKTPTHSGSKGNPGLIRLSRAYFTPELEARLNGIMSELPIARQAKIDQLFEVMEDINHTRRAIQEQRSPIPVLLEVEFRTSLMYDYITHSDYVRFIDEAVAIENYMNIEQWNDALFKLSKLKLSVADVFLADFPEKTKKEIVDIVKAIWRTR